MTAENSLIKSKITLLELKLNVFLGWPKSERIKKQTISLQVEIDFPEPPLGCVTDNLDDTFCYAELVKTIQETINTREFHLVEYLGHEIYHTIKQKLSSSVNVMVHITKKPSVLKSLANGVKFSYGDK